MSELNTCSTIDQNFKTFPFNLDPETIIKLLSCFYMPWGPLLKVSSHFAKIDLVELAF